MKLRTLMILSAVLIWLCAVPAAAEEPAYRIDTRYGDKIEVPAQETLNQSFGLVYVSDEQGNSYFEPGMVWSLTRLSGECEMRLVSDNNDELFIGQTGPAGRSVFEISVSHAMFGRLSAQIVVESVDYVYAEQFEYAQHTYTLKAGQPLEIAAPQIKPLGSRLKAGDMWGGQYLANFAQYADKGQAKLNVSISDGSISFRCDVPGTYEMLVVLTRQDGQGSSDNVYTWPMVFRVSDENGVVPPPELSVSAREVTRTFYKDASFSGSYDFTNLSTVYHSRNDYRPVWACEQISGAPVKTGFEYYDNTHKTAYFTVDGKVNPGTYTFRVTATAEESVGSIDLELIVLAAPESTPTGIVYPVSECVFIKPGESFTLEEPVLKPANAVMPEAARYVVKTVAGEKAGYLSVKVDEKNGRHTFTPRGEGVYRLELWAMLGDNYSIRGQNLYLVSANDAGDLSACVSPTLYLWDITLNPPYAAGDELGNFILKTSEVYPPDAKFEFTVEFVDGVDCLDYTLRQDRLGVTIRFKKLRSTGAGRYRVSAVCEQYNLRASEEFIIKSNERYMEDLVAPTGTTLSKSKAAVNQNERVKLRVAKFKPAKTSKILKKVIWESEDPAIATVDQDGYITGVNVGQTMIRAYAVDVNGQKNPQVYSSCLITVRPPKISALAFTQAELTLEKGRDYDLETLLAIEPIGGSGTVTWKSAKPKIAKVKNGVVSAKKAGSAKITASVKGNKRVKAIITVNVVNPQAAVEE